jgi:hypothetical protein
MTAAQKAAQAKTQAATAAQQKFQAQQAADAKAAQDKANAATQAAAEAQAALNKKFNDQIQAAKTTTELTQLQAQARTAGATVDPTVVSRASEQIAQTQVAERAAQAQAAQQRQQAQDAKLAAEQQAAAQLRAQQAAEKAAADKVAADAAAVKAQQDAQAQAAQAAKDAADTQAAAEKAAAQPVVPVVPVVPTKPLVTSMDFQNALATVKTQGELDALVAQAKAAGKPINQGYIDQTTIAVKQRQATVDKQLAQSKSQFETAQKAGGTFGKLSFDTSINQQDLDPAVMNSFGADINRVTQNGKIAMQMSDPTAPGYVAPSQLAAWMKSGDTYRADLQKTLDQVAKLPEPGAGDYNRVINGFDLTAIPDDPTTKDVNESGYYIQTPEGIQKVGSDAKVSGPVVPDFDTLNKNRLTITNNISDYQQQQEADKTAAQVASRNATLAEFESKLPDPTSLPNGAVRYAPGGVEYNLTPKNLATGEPGRWIKMDENMVNTDLTTGKTFNSTEYNKQLRTIEDSNNVVLAQQRAAQAEADRTKNDFTWEDLRNIAGIVGVAALGVAAFNAIGSGALATEAASTAGGMAAEGATAGEITSTLTAGGVAPEAAVSIANTATGITTGTIDAGALASSGGFTPEVLSAAGSSANPIASVTQSLYELNALETAELLKNIDPAMISSLAPTTSGTVGGTASSIFSGSSLNPITNVLTNIGVTNPIVSGALTGVGTGAVINTLTGQPITSDSLLLSALGGGVAGGIGSVLPDLGGGMLGSALAGAATNVGATAVVSAVTGQPITLSNLATAALIGGTVGAGIQVATDGAGNTTYQYDDGSSMTVNRVGTPVAVTDSAGAQVPVAAVDSRTGELKQLAPVEDAVARTPEQIAAQTQPVVPGTVDVGNMTQEQLNQALSQNNPYLTTSDATQVAGPYTPEQEAQYNRLIAEGRTPAEATDQIESGTETGPAIPVSISGAAGTAEAPSYAISNQMTPGSQLATQTQIDSGQATYNSAANAWEVTPAPAPVAPPVIAPPPLTVIGGPYVPYVPPPDPGQLPPASTPDGSGGVPQLPPDPGQQLPGGSGPQPDVPVTLVETTPVAPVPTQPELPAPGPETEPNPPAPELPAPAPQPAPQPAPAPAPEQPTQPVEPVYPPVYVPPVDTATPVTRSYGPITPLDWGRGVPLDMSGLNPGYITNVPRYYNNPSPVAAQYYWGQRPYQTGTEFDPVLYNTLPVAPPTPFGLQQMYDPTTQTITNLLRGVGQASQVAPYNIPQAPRV